MAASIITAFCFNPDASGSSAGLLALVAPTASTLTTGWTVGTTVAARWSRQTYRTEKAAATFTTTAQPNGGPSPAATGFRGAADCWRLSAATTGDFSAGTWYSQVSVIAVTNATSQRGRAIFSIYKGSIESGTGATRVHLGSNMTGTTLASALLTTAAQTSSASTQIGAFSLANEYLFMQCAWETTTAATNANADVLIRAGPLSIGNGSGVITPTFTTAAGADPMGGGGFLRRRRDAMAGAA